MGWVPNASHQHGCWLPWLRPWQIRKNHAASGLVAGTWCSPSFTRGKLLGATYILELQAHSHDEHCRKFQEKQIHYGLCWRPLLLQSSERVPDRWNPAWHVTSYAASCKNLWQMLEQDLKLEVLGPVHLENFLTLRLYVWSWSSTTSLHRVP